jgi:predicted HTH transcriptional regulator
MKNEINYLHKHIEELSTRSASETGQLNIKTDLFIVNHPKNDSRAAVPKTQMSFKESREDKPLQEVSFKKIPVKGAPVRPVESKDKDDREKRVLDVIRDKGVVSIKDISTVIFDVSEKTIQRTLQLLIDKGQIKKEGERRWAKYQLV